MTARDPRRGLTNAPVDRVPPPASESVPQVPPTAAALTRESKNGDFAKTLYFMVPMRIRTSDPRIMNGRPTRPR